MPKYTVRLESQTDSQARLIDVYDAPDADAARAEAESNELDIVRFSLLPPEKDVWEQPPGLSQDEPDALVDLSRWDAHDKEWAEYAAGLSYKGAVKAANLRLQDYECRTDIGRNGKVKRTSLKGRPLARLLAHHQSEPYQVVDVQEISQAEIDQQRLVMAAKALQEDPAAWAATLERLRAEGIPLNVVTAFLNGLTWQAQISGSSVTVFSSATIQMSLHTGLTGNQDTDDFYSDISATEITGTGYTANGYTFANKTATYDTSTDQVRLDNTVDPNWTSSTLSATDAAVWNNTAGASSTDPIHGEIDFGQTVSTTNGTFTVALDATGWAVFDLT